VFDTFELLSRDGQSVFAAPHNPNYTGKILTVKAVEQTFLMQRRKNRHQARGLSAPALLVRREKRPS
jgi:hypothetical protein